MSRLVVIACLCVSGCYLSHTRAADEPRGPDAGALPTTTLDAGAGLEGGVTTGTATIDETLTCGNGPERWAAACPDAMIVYVSTEGRDDAMGSVADPVASARRAVELCGDRACHVRLVAGTYAMGADNLYGGCLYVEGGGTLRADGAWTAFAGTPSTLLGNGANDSMISSPGALVVTGVSIHDVETAISINRGYLLVVDQVSIDGAHTSGVSVSWSSHGARICNTTIVADYSAVDISWSSSDVVLDHVDATGGYSGIDVSWSSHDVSVRDSTIRGGYEGVGVNQGAYDVQLKGSVVITTGDYHGS